VYEIFDHTADMGLRVHGRTREEAYTDAALGLTQIIAGDLEQIHPITQETIDVPGNDPALLMFDWLNELPYAFESRRMLGARFEIEVKREGIHATVYGERYDPARHTLCHEVKAITYHGLKMEQAADGWVATVIVDI
jgi:SHS2 domain-containing protein